MTESSRHGDGLDKNYNFIKGRIAEAIVERLFISLGMIPIPNGYEIRHPDIAHLRRKGELSGDALRRIEFGCDFIVRSAVKNADQLYDIYQIEVKFSRSGQIDTGKLKVYDNEDMLFIFLDFDGFWCIANRDLKSLPSTSKSAKLKFASLTRLEDYQAFAFSSAQVQIIRQFVHFIHATLKKAAADSDVRETLRVGASV